MCLPTSLQKAGSSGPQKSAGMQQVSHDKIGSIPLGSFVAVSAKAKCGCCRAMSRDDAAEAIKKCRRCAWGWASFCAHAQLHGVMLARRLLQGDGPGGNENFNATFYMIFGHV